MHLRFLFGLIFFAQLIIAQQKISCSFSNNSYLAISGTSNIVPYKLTQDAKYFLSKNITFDATKTDNRIYLSADKLDVPVKNFSSENPFILPDFRKLLKYDQYPYITISLLFIETNEENLNSDISAGIIHTNITIAGQTRRTEIRVYSKMKENTMSISGEKKLNIHDFGLKAPSDPFGIIKVSEWINIDFNILFDFQLLN